VISFPKLWRAISEKGNATYSYKLTVLKTSWLVRSGWQQFTLTDNAKKMVEEGCGKNKLLNIY